MDPPQALASTNKVARPRVPAVRIRAGGLSLVVSLAEVAFGVGDAKRSAIATEAVRGAPRAPALLPYPSQAGRARDGQSKSLPNGGVSPV
jgi:hypothetical protein